MTEFDLLKLIGETKDDYIMASRHRPKKKSSQVPKILAACLLAAVLGGAGRLVWSNFSAGSTAAAQSDTAETAAVTAETAENETVAEEAPAEAASAYDVTLLAQAVYPEPISAENYEAQKTLWTENQVTEETHTAMNDFAYRTAALLLSGGTESQCYSPLSLYSALSLLASGAQGETQSELLALLGQNDPDTLAEESGKLYRVNYQNNEEGLLQIANSLWLDDKAADGTAIDYSENWVQSAAENYYADVYQADFSNDSTAQALGAWVAEKTGSLLQPTQEDLGIDQDTALALVNTLWYRSGWTSEFNPDKTETGDFTTAAGETIQAEFMHQTNDTGYYIRGEGYTKSYLRLYSGDMIIVLPEEGVDVDDLLTEEKLWEIFENGDYRSGEIRWSVPKFQTDTQLDLSDTLQSLGVTTAFSLNADFSEISTSGLYLSSIRQGTHIALDEEGVEAVSYTAAASVEASEPDEDPTVVEMNLDRPFIYLITANDGSPLFLGVVRTLQDA
jgi:serpin B